VLWSALSASSSAAAPPNCSRMAAPMWPGGHGTARASPRRTGRMQAPRTHALGGAAGRCRHTYAARRFRLHSIDRQRSGS
jgi:hypothetical protein